MDKSKNNDLTSHHPKMHGDANPALVAATDINRRHFVQGLASGGLLAATGLWSPRTIAQETIGGIPVLSGREISLSIGKSDVNFTGKRREAITVNGMIPAPVIRLREGDHVALRVTNRLGEPSSIHWHGLLLPFDMDGVPGVAFPGIGAQESFVYRFKVRQSGTYWYHSHSGFQEQLGLYGPLIIDPAGPDPVVSDREYVLMLSDWTDHDPHWVFRRLKQSSDFFNYQMPTVAELVDDIRTMGAAQAIDKRKMWNEMRMNPTDLGDVSGAAFTYLINGKTPAGNWTAIARPGEKVRLRIINAAATTIFDLRIPGVKMTVVSADGQNVEPVQVDEIRLSVAETYDVIVEMPQERAYTVFAQSIDRSGYARATLAPRPGMTGPVPQMDPKAWLSMDDMGMGDMPGHGAGHGPAMPAASAPPANPAAGHDVAPSNAMTADGPHAGHGATSTPPGAQKSHAAASPLSVGGHESHSTSTLPAASQAPDMGVMKDTKGLTTQRGVDVRVMSPSRSLSDPGPRLRDNGRRVLTYADLRTVGGPLDERPPSREMILRLTGNMQRFVWGFDGKKFSEQAKIYFKYGERLRVTLINDTMMNHPIHLHGMWSEIVNENGGFQVRKHTINVQPSKQISFLVTVDAPGQWAFHCHLLYHMEAGMFRTVVVV